MKKKKKKKEKKKHKKYLHASLCCKAYKNVENYAK